MADPRVKQETNERPPVVAQAEWDDPMACPLKELLLVRIKEAFQGAMRKIVEMGYSEEEAEWAVRSCGLYIGNKNLSSDIAGAAMALLANREHSNTIKPLLFQSVERLENYTLVEMVNQVIKLKPHLTVAGAIWLLLISDLKVLQGQSLHHFTPASSKNNFSLYHFTPASSKNNLSSEAKKDAASLMLQNHWTNLKVMQQAAQNTRKSISELESVLANINELKQLANSAVLQAEAEHAMLMKRLLDSRLIFETSSQLLQETKMREQDLLREFAGLQWEEANQAGDNSTQVGITRKRACVMCPNEESCVLFLPCAHQILCIFCNVLHEQKGTNECPLCRTPIVQRLYSFVA